MRLTKYDKPQRSKKQWYEVAAKNGISKGLFFNRLKQGWTERDAATVEKREYSLKNPQPKSELTLLAEKSGFTYNTIHSRLNRGWSVKDATTIPVQKKGKREAKA